MECQKRDGTGWDGESICNACNGDGFVGDVDDKDLVDDEGPLPDDE